MNTLGLFTNRVGRSKMITRSSSRIWSVSEGLTWRRQPVQKGKCMRCLHASRKLWAESNANGSDSGAPYNTPDTGPTRHLREAINSNQAKMALRDDSSPPSANKSVKSKAPAESVPPRRMGENDSPIQEGPLAQGVAKTAAEGDVADTTSMARGVRSPHDAVDDPAQGGAAVLESAGTSLPVDGSAANGGKTRLKVASVDRDNIESPMNVEDKATMAPTQPHEIPEPTSRSLALESAVPATWERGDQDASLQQHIDAAIGTNIIENHRNTAYLAGRLVSGRPVRFSSYEEKAAAEELATNIAKSRAERYSGTKPPAYKTANLPESVSRGIASAMIAGRHDDFELLKKSSSGKRVQDGIMRQIIINETYLRSDRERFIGKVQSLLPASSRTPLRK